MRLWGDYAAVVSCYPHSATSDCCNRQQQQTLQPPITLVHCDLSKTDGKKKKGNERESEQRPSVNVFMKQKLRLRVWSHFILIVHLLTLKISVEIQPHVNSVSVNIQQKCLLTVSMFYCSRLLTDIQLTVCTLSQNLKSWKATVWCQHIIKSITVIYSWLSTDY